ncbi:hypothetical protein J5O04_02885 [Corynebacterium hindlerae]|uniref:hypothetical protein n=1 Tax=Corynebacterium hindlerae TaxID=699041 RepID=UPI001AD7AA27|nr:hypothetical protein [Corynebacterium hindlerae]QTH60096.1 hypothetical protein J5O04_02885 [Corynebacterium hindlerae]
MPKQTPPEIISEILRLTGEGHTRRQVAGALGLAPSTVQDVLTRHGATPTAERMEKAEEHLQQIEHLRTQIWAPGMNTKAQCYLAERMADHAKEIAQLMRVGGGNE